MKRKTTIEIEFPWQIEVMLAGVAMVASGLVVFLGMTVLDVLVNSSLGGLFAGIGVEPVPVSSTANAWPFLLMAFGIFSVRWYLLLRQFAARRLATF